LCGWIMAEKKLKLDNVVKQKMTAQNGIEWQIRGARSFRQLATLTIETIIFYKSYGAGYMAIRHLA